MKKAKILALALTVVLVCSLFAGCSLGNKTIVEIAGVKISEDVYTSAVNQANSYFEQQMGTKLNDFLDETLADGRTGAMLLRDEADSLLRELACIKPFAEKYGISLSAEEKKEIKASKKQQIETMGGKKAFIDALKASGVNEAYYDFLIEGQMLYSKVYTELFTGDGEFALSADEIAKNLLDGGYVRVKHVLVLAAEGDADFAEKKAKAEDIAKRAKAGEDFDALITEFGEDPGMQSQPEGYLIDKEGYTPEGGQMVAEFTNASIALPVDGVSGLVKSDYGYHIIKRYPLTKEYIEANLDLYSGTFATPLLAEKIAEFNESVEIVKTSNYDKINLHKILGVEEKLGVEEHSEDDGHDHSADAQ